MEAGPGEPEVWRGHHVQLLTACAPVWPITLCALNDVVGDLGPLSAPLLSVNGTKQGSFDLWENL